MPKEILPEHWELAERLADLIQQNNPKAVVKGAQVKAWADVVRKMVDIDGHSLEDIRKVLEWTQQDDFWSTNILSMDKLRKQWNQLTVKMDGPKIKKKRTWEDAIRE